MALDAGSVYATLGGRFSPAGFQAFGSAMVRARTQMEDGEKRMKTSAQRTSASLHALGHAAKVGAGAGILGLTAVLASSVKSAADFEAQLSSLQSVSSATGRQMQQLRKSAMDAGAATKYSALDAAKAQTELAKGGLSVTKILGGGLKGALALAAAGEMDLADAASTTANALNLFNLNGSQAGHVADALATAANTTTADVSDFAIALTQGGAAAKAAGFSFNETVTYLEALANAGVKGSDAGTSMKAALTQIANPTKQAAGLMADLNLQFFDAQGKIKPLPAIAANLDRAFGGLTKQQRLQAAATIAGTDGMRGLLALYDSSPAQLRKWQDGLSKSGTAAEVAAKKQDNLKGRIENLKGSLETAGIALGTRLLPYLTQGAEKATDFINRLSAEGKIDQFATGLIHGGEKAATVLQDIGQAGAHIASDLAPAVGVLRDIADALNLSDPGHIEAILAAIAGFKVANVVAPMVATLAQNLSLLATAPTVGALVGDLAAMVNPITAVALAVGGIGAALVLLSGKEDSETAAARRSAEAHKAQAEAIKAVGDAERAAADKGLAAQQATLDRQRAEQNLAAVQARVKDGDLKGADAKRELAAAELDVRQATLRSSSAHQAYTESINRQHSVNQRRIDDARKYVDATKDEVKAAQDIAFVQSRTGNRNDQAAANRKLQEAQERNTTAVQRYVQAVARAQVSDVSRQRLMHASTQITEENAQGIAKLIGSINQLPRSKQTRLLLTGNQQILSELGSLSSQLNEMGRRRTVTKILAETSSARAAVVAMKALIAGVPQRTVARIVGETRGKAEIDALNAAIAAVHSKSVAIDVTTRYHQIGSPPANAGVGTVTPGGPRQIPHQAQGRGSGKAETSLVGEGRVAREAVVDPASGTAFVVDRPTIVDLPDTAYVIPQDRAYRGRAMGLLADLATDLGLRGFDKGKKGKNNKKSKAKKHRYVPPHLDPLSLPVDDFEKKEQKARDTYKDVRDDVHEEPRKIRTIQAQIRDIQRRQPRSAAQKANKADDLRRAQKKLREERAKLAKAKADLPKRRADWQQRRKELRSAKTFAARVKKQQDLADIAADKMRLADQNDDQAAYDKAKGQRDTALGKYRAMLKAAGEHVPDNSAYGREIAKGISGVDVDIAENRDAEINIDAAPEPDLTDAEKTRLGEINKGIALAALTETLEDDKTAAGDLVTFLQGVLDQAVGGQRPADDSFITDIAGQLKQAKDNVASLTGNGTNTNQDVQAQIDQAREQARVATESARINAQALAVFAGTGDIGTGGVNALAAARSAPTVVNNYNMPGAPHVLRAIGDAATQGQSMQPYIKSSVERLGI